MIYIEHGNEASCILDPHCRWKYWSAS